jgi:membrane protease YdiL (CAAX protease family)
MTDADSSEGTEASWREQLIGWNESEQRPRLVTRLFWSSCVGIWTGVITIILVGVVALTASSILPGWMAETVVGGVIVGLWEQVLGAGAVTLGVITAAVVVDRRQISDLGFHRKKAWIVNFVFGCLLGLGIATGKLAVGIAAGWITITGVLTGVAEQQVALYVFWQFIFYLCVGVREEVVFRGYLLPNIAEGLRGFDSLDASRASWGAVVMTSLAFIGLHWGSSLTLLVIAGLFGIVFGVAYLLTDSLAIPIGLHTAWDLAVVALYGPSTKRTGGKLVEITGNPIGIAFGITSLSLVSWLMIGVGLILLLIWVRFREGELRIQPGSSEPNFHDSHVSRRFQSWFSLRPHESTEEPPSS